MSRETINSSTPLDRRSKRVSKQRDCEISTRLRKLPLGQLGRIPTDRRTRYEYIAFGIDNVVTINSCLRIRTTDDIRTTRSTVVIGTNRYQLKTCGQKDTVDTVGIDIRARGNSVGIDEIRGYSE
jgi:hypothetical protein